MSKKSKAVDVQIRCGVLSCFNYKKKTLLQKEAYELSPMYWKCFRHRNTGSLILQGYRSEVSHKDKPRVNMVVNGCTTELLPPILKAKGKDYPGNDNYLGIQAEDDKIVFLKAEGRSQRDLWYKDIMEALGDRGSATISNEMDAPSPEQRSPSQAERRPMRPSLKDKVDNDNHSLDDNVVNMGGQSDVYHVPYQDYEPMRCSSSTDDDGNSWTGTKPRSMSTTEHTSPIVSDVGEEEAVSSEKSDMDDDGYVFPTSLANTPTDLPPESVDVSLSTGGLRSASPKATPLSAPRFPEAKLMLPVVADDRPTISPNFLESLKQVQESKPRPFDIPSDKPRPIDTPTDKPRYTGVPRRSKPPPLPEAVPKMPALPMLPKDLKQATLEMKTLTPEEIVSQSKSPIKSLKTPDPERMRKSAKKPMKMPPPLPAGGNSKPKPPSATIEKQDGLPHLPPFPQPRNKPTPAGESASSSSESSPVKQTGAGANEKVYQFVKSFRGTQMSSDTKSIEIAKEAVQERETLELTNIKDMVFVAAFGNALCTTELLVGDEVRMIDNHAITSVEEATKCIQASDGESVTFSINKIPHGVLSYISRSQEPSIDLKKLGLTLRGNEVTKFDSEGLVARSGIPSRQLVPGITNNGELVNWALTQINMIPIYGSITAPQVEQILSEAGNTVALVFHPADFAAALAQ